MYVCTYARKLITLCACVVCHAMLGYALFRFTSCSATLRYVVFCYAF